MTVAAGERSRGWGHHAALAQVTFEMFGSRQAAAYREPLRQAAERVLEAGKARDWGALAEARDALADVLTEYEFTAAPIRSGVRVSLAEAVPLFEVPS